MKTFTLTTPAGVVFHVRPHSKDCETVFYYWIHGEPVYNVKGLSIPDNSVIIDIGAHIGTVSLRMATAAKNVKVYAFEPFPENFALLKKNICENNLDKVITPYKLAISNINRKRNLFTCTERTDGHTFYKHKDFKFGKAINVNCITLPEFLSKEKIKQVEFLKIDAEGAEYDIFLEGDISFLDKVKKIGMECHPCHPKYKASDIVRVLRKKGFQVIDEDGELFAKK
ncbi:MAG: FkbM family methyltransferase [bacterium]